jgi:inhibitor of KinA sporulation pathway (predicted exonuclease)
MRYDKVLIVDLEATCWETREESTKYISEILEIGVVLFNLQTKLVEKSQGILVKPVVSHISPFCTQLTTITKELVDAEGVSFPDAYDILVDEYNSRDYPWMSWGAYDKNMFDRQCSRYECQSPMSNLHTNLKVVHAMASKKHRAVGMEAALAELKIPLNGTHHRGIDDALNITKIFQALLLK